MKVSEPELAALAVRVEEQHRQLLGGELGEDLQTETARGRWGPGVGDHRERLDLERSRRHGAADGDSLGAHRRAEAPVLDVAADKDPSVRRPDGGSHPETTVGGVGVLACAPGSVDQWLPVHRGESTMTRRAPVLDFAAREHSALRDIFYISTEE